MKALKSQNYYEILGVARSASSEEIRNAYELSRHTFQENSLATYSLFTDEENQEILALISRAYETLFNPELRREYDTFLNGLEREGLPLREVRPPLLTRPPLSRGPQGPPRGRTASMAAPAAPNAAPPTATLGAAQQPVAMMRGAVARPQREPEQAAAVRAAQPPEPRAPEPLSAEPLPEQRPPEPSPQDEAAEKYIQSVSSYTGPVLKKIRQMRGLSLEDIAERTKIRKTYIGYLEDEEFKFLPAPVYVKGFVTLIAGMLDLPAQRVAEEYMSYYRDNDQL